MEVLIGLLLGVLLTVNLGLLGGYIYFLIKGRRGKEERRPPPQETENERLMQETKKLHLLREKAEQLALPPLTQGTAWYEGTIERLTRRKIRLDHIAARIEVEEAIQRAEKALQEQEGALQERAKALQQQVAEKPSQTP